MAAIVVPFRGSGSKRRLDGITDAARAELALAMLGDVLAAAVAFGPTSVVTGDSVAAQLVRDLGAEVVDDPGRGQGAAVEAALAPLGDGPVLVVNADVPCVTPHDLRALAAAVPTGGLALVEARDGTTNALGVAVPQLFVPLYGPGSAGRFLSLGVQTVAVVIPDLRDDVDTIADLRRVSLRAGPRTQAAIATFGIAA
jgi:2-phospho-L-lactate guanylyltransferase